jgi:ornithine carbamoyltransferase
MYLVRTFRNTKLNTKVKFLNNFENKVWEELEALNIKYSSAKVKYFTDPKLAAKDSDIIYTDSWMSYGIPTEIKHIREAVFEPYRVTSELMKLAKPDAIFMNCLPADRTEEQTSEVIDGNQSVVFDQAENRLHTAKAILLFFNGYKGSKMVNIE